VNAALQNDWPGIFLKVAVSAESKEERVFMLGDEDGKDVGATLSNPMPAPASQRTEYVVAIPSDSGDAIQNANTVTIRGRDLGGGDITRL
jgi:hypothetical protein